MRASRRTLQILAAIAFLTASLATNGPALAQPSIELEVNGYPAQIAPEGEPVRFSVNVIAPANELPVTITSIVSDLHGDVADPGNPALLSTDCEVPAAYEDDTPGWVGWACLYEVTMGGAPGPVTNTIDVTVQLEDDIEILVSDGVTLTVSDQLGTLRGTLLDADTGAPIPNTWVFVADAAGPTDATGTFTIVGLDPGSYILHSGSKHPGGWERGPPPDYQTPYAYERYDEDPLGPTNDANVTPVTILAGEVTEVVWELSIGGSIEGILRDAASGRAVTDLDIYWWVRDAARPSPTEAGGYVDVADDGTYRVFSLRGGDHMVCFDRAGNAECWDDRPMVSPLIDSPGDPVPVSLGQTTVGIDAVFGQAPPVDPGDGGEGGEGGEDDTAPALPRTGGRTVLLLFFGLSLLAAGSSLLFATRQTDSVAAPPRVH